VSWQSEVFVEVIVAEEGIAPGAGGAGGGCGTRVAVLDSV